MTATLRKVRHRVEVMKKHLQGKLLLSEPMAGHVTLGVGGSADAFFSPEDKEDLLRCLKLSHELVIPYMIIGNGSNVIIRDGGFRGLIISTTRLVKLEVGETDLKDGKVEVMAECGMLLSRLLNSCVEKGLAGLEFTAGIPGTVGGAVIMNAGAHGSSLEEVIGWIELADADGELHRILREEMECGYRFCRLPLEGVVTAAGFLLHRKEDRDILDGVKWCLREREKRLPFGWMNAGSIFKNPPDDSAGRIIDELGFKGYRVGKAMVSQEHANVIINLGGAKARDIVDIMEEIIKECREKKGLTLEPEIKIVGEP